MISSEAGLGQNIDTFIHSEQTRALLEIYSHIPPSDVLRHVAEIVSRRSP